MSTQTRVALCRVVLGESGTLCCVDYLNLVATTIEAAGPPNPGVTDGTGLRRVPKVAKAETGGHSVDSKEMSSGHPPPPTSTD